MVQLDLVWDVFLLEWRVLLGHIYIFINLANHRITGRMLNGIFDGDGDGDNNETLYRRSPVGRGNPETVQDKTAENRTGDKCDRVLLHEGWWVVDAPRNPTFIEKDVVVRCCQLPRADCNKLWGICYVY